MLKQALYLSLAVALFVGCKKDKDEVDNCEQPIGSEQLVFQYFNESIPEISSTPIEAKGNISYGEAFAQPTENGVEIVIPDVRIRTDQNNFAINTVKIDETAPLGECYILQDEFDTQQSSFQTN